MMLMLHFPLLVSLFCLHLRDEPSGKWHLLPCVGIKHLHYLFSADTSPSVGTFSKTITKKHQFFTTNVVFITKMFWQLVMFSTSFLCFQIFLKINFHRVLYFKLFMVFVSLFCKQLLEIKWKTIKICFKKHMFPFF